MHKLEQYTKYLIYLCRCTIEGRNAEYVPEWLDLNEFLEFCLNHKLENIAYFALNNTDAHKLDEEIWLIFEDLYLQDVLIDATQQYHLDIIKDAFNKNGIKYIVLKGMVMKLLYPTSDLRQSADIDIFIWAEQMEAADKIMKELGFECTAEAGMESTANYEMEPFSEIELHSHLILEDYKWQTECNYIPGRAVQRQGCESVMSDADFYVFMLCHIAKHVAVGGIGIRAILDIWVYRRHFKNLDWDAINAVIERCGLTEFNNNILALADHWFNDKPADKRIEILAQYIALSGWNGIEEQWQASELHSNAGIANSRGYAKLRKYIRYAFWDRKHMSLKYPILDKYPALLPFCWAHRGINAIIHKRDTVKNLTKSYDYINIELMNGINRFRKDIGL